MKQAALLTGFSLIKTERKTEMSILMRLGERLYEFYSQHDIIKATSLYAHFAGNQDEFEDKMEDEGIEFCYAE